MDLYREAILEHYKNPHNFGHLDGADVITQDANPSCGDKISIEIRMIEKDGITIVSDITFTGEGCAIHQASASMLTDDVKQKSIEEIMKLNLEHVQQLLGTTLTPSRVKCALLPLEAIQKAISRYNPSGRSN